MNLLLDTHVWVWAENTPEKIGKRTRNLLVEEVHVNYVSAVSALELARLVSAGKIELGIELREWMRLSQVSLQISALDVTQDIAIEAYSLPGEFHPDPADRILVATARLFSASLITADEQILSYRQVKTIDARK